MHKSIDCIALTSTRACVSGCCFSMPVFSYLLSGPSFQFVIQLWVMKESFMFHQNWCLYTVIRYLFNIYLQLTLVVHIVNTNLETSSDSDAYLYAFYASRSLERSHLRCLFMELKFLHFHWKFCEVLQYIKSSLQIKICPNQYLMSHCALKNLLFIFFPDSCVGLIFNHFTGNKVTWFGWFQINLSY